MRFIKMFRILNINLKKISFFTWLIVNFLKSSLHLKKSSIYLNPFTDIFRETAQQHKLFKSEHLRYEDLLLYLSYIYY